MKVKQLKALCEMLLAEKIRNNAQGHGVEKLFSNLPSTKPVNSILNELEKSFALRSQESHAALTIESSTLANHLAKLNEALQGMLTAGSKKTIDRLVEYLRSSGSMDASEALTPPVYSQLVPLLADKLKEAGVNRSAFNELLDSIESAKAKFSVSDMKSLVSLYTGAPEKSGSKPKQLQRIVDHFEIEAQQSTRHTQIGKLAG